MDEDLVYKGIFRNDVLGCYGIIIKNDSEWYPDSPGETSIYKGEINCWEKKWIWNINKFKT